MVPSPATSTTNANSATTTTTTTTTTPVITLNRNCTHLQPPNHNEKAPIITASAIITSSPSGEEYENVSICSSLSSVSGKNNYNQGHSTNAAPSASSSSLIGTTIETTTSSSPSSPPPVLRKKKSKFTVTKATELPSRSSITSTAALSGNADAISISFLNFNGTSSSKEPPTSANKEATKQVIQRALAGLRPGGVFFVLDYKNDDNAILLDEDPPSAWTSTATATASTSTTTDTTTTTTLTEPIMRQNHSTQPATVAAAKDGSARPTSSPKSNSQSDYSSVRTKSPQSYSVAMKDIPDELVHQWNLTMVPTNLDTYYRDTHTLAPTTTTRKTTGTTTASSTWRSHHHTLRPASSPQIVRWMGFKPTTTV